MLTAKQDRFVEAYVTGLSGAQAAMRAGYSPRTARSIASENLRKPEIAAAIEQHAAKRRRKDYVLTNLVLDKLKNVASSNIQDFLDNGRVKSPDEWSQAMWDAIKKVTFHQTIERRKDGSIKCVVQVIGLRMENSMKALSLLGDHLGLFPKARRSSKAKDPDFNGPFVSFNVHSGPRKREASER